MFVFWFLLKKCSFSEELTSEQNQVKQKEAFSWKLVINYLLTTSFISYTQIRTCVTLSWVADPRTDPVSCTPIKDHWQLLTFVLIMPHALLIKSPIDCNYFLLPSAHQNVTSFSQICPTYFIDHFYGIFMPNFMCIAPPLVKIGLSLPPYSTPRSVSGSKRR